MPYFQANTELLEQLKGHSKNSLLYKCASVIEELQQQVENYLKINAEQRQLIEIIQKEKQFYESQCVDRKFDKQIIKIQQQWAHMSSLLNIHQKDNNELKLKITQLEQQMAQKNKIISAKSSQIETINLEKLILQKQWNRIVKAIKRKISKIVEQGHHNPQNKENENPSSIKRQKNLVIADSMKINFNSNIKGKQSTRNESLMYRADSMIRFINQKLAISELENILTETNSTQKKRERQTEYNELPYKIEFY